MNIGPNIKVLYILNATIMGGANISFLNMISGLHERNIEVYIAHPDKHIDETFKKVTQQYVKEYYYIPMHAKIYEDDWGDINKKIKNALKKMLNINGLRLVQETKAITELISMINPDIIHTNCGVMHCGYFAAKKTGIPHIWHLREYQTKDFGWNISPSKSRFISYLHDSHVITITKDILDFFGLLDDPKAECIYNGCFSKDDISEIYPKEKYFLCCSRISPEKGQDEVIRAFSILHRENKNYRLVIAGFGDEEYIKELRTLVTDLDCADKVEFIGYKENVRPLMDKATALVVASRFEGFGRMTAEAAFRGCLVIGKATGGTKEILEQTGGYLYSEGYNELAEKMKEIISLDENEYCKRMHYAIDKAVNLFSNEQAVEKIYSIYKRIIIRQKIAK